MRNRKKKEKIRVCVNLDKEVIERIDDYIDNLSAFINKTLKNYIELKDKELLSSENSSNIGYVQNCDHKKRTSIVDNEVLNTDNKWWDS